MSTTERTAIYMLTLWVSCLLSSTFDWVYFFAVVLRACSIMHNYNLLKMVPVPRPRVHEKWQGLCNVCAQIAVLPIVFI